MERIYHYFVEGECEKKLIDYLKSISETYLIPGKVEVYNFINKKISNPRLAVLKPNTTIILVYDIDVNKTDIFEYNIRLLKKNDFKNVYHIQSILNFEDEIVFSTNLKNINEMFKTESVERFKTTFLDHKDIGSKLKSVAFDRTKIWSRELKSSKNPFVKYANKNYINLLIINKR